MARIPSPDCVRNHPGARTRFDRYRSITGNILTLKGEKKEEQEEKDERRHYVERYYGSFQRSFQLPADVRTDKIEATFDKGVLKITLPKTEQAKKKDIQIKVK